MSRVIELKEPKWFVQTDDKTLHGYWTRDILLCDLTLNRGESVLILERVPGIAVRYVPTTEAAIRERKEA